jgi:antitoxin (DNA-binding transcriptional repressor) of toxin-antitoxin stability system
MATKVSKSRYKANALALFREIERTGQPIVITDHGTPVLTVAPYRADPDSTLTALRETVARYEAPTKPVGDTDWESNS